MSHLHVLLTGGTGFVGTAILKALDEYHPEYRVSVLDFISESRWARPNTAFDIQYYQADITNRHQVSEAIHACKPTIVIHTAGMVTKNNSRYRDPNPEIVFRINVEGTRNVLDAAKSSGATSFVYTSSVTIVTDDQDHDYPNVNETVPTGFALCTYGQSKLAAEKVVLAANSPEFATCALRPSTLMGPGDTNLVPTIQRCIAEFETPFIIGSGLNLYDFTYVGNVADAHVLAAENLTRPHADDRTAAGEAIFITNGQPVPFRSFCLAVWAEWGHAPPFEIHVPKRVAWTAGYLAEWWTWIRGTEATLCRGSVKDYCQTAYADISKSRRILGYEPRVGLPEGIKISCADLKRRMEENKLS
ncbi:putative NAD dependent epimerase/dehydratase [Eremomyces bilateralis CBS 781.70]|uniref:NAD dependent epimerase/dehydratase n=1 Tax=Eremomyces bilateralis CBS 781.70 TaxID=1392243 RepID=A0A6G1GCP0_9PEZI|nr:putative NAD dependent epimerase/dehydratase [Eremomyces bilateralis CBS 781.70]KAF1815858.1 putative NAD dependent epimerase/dehydratase [Eremomyces bilateralis CBS 781.70]